MRTHTKETTWIQDWASPNHQEHPVQDASSKQQTKQIYTRSSADRITTPLSFAHHRKNKQKLGTNLTLYKAYRNHWANLQFSSVQLLSRVQLFETPWIAALQASLSITSSQSLLKLMSMESVMPSSHLILCRPLLLLSPLPPRRAETKRKKEFNLEAWEKETSNTIS